VSWPIADLQHIQISGTNPFRNDPRKLDSNELFHDLAAYQPKCDWSVLATEFKCKVEERPTSSFEIGPRREIFDGQPTDEAMEVSREAEKPHGVGIAIKPYGDVVGAVAYVDPSGVGMHHLESRIGGLQAAGQLFALLPVQR
jgi:hypothetical protein